MEAVWKRLIQLLAAGLLLTLSFLPMQVFSLPPQVSDKTFSPEYVRSREPLKEDHNTHTIFHTSRTLFNCSMIMEIDTPDEPIIRGEDYYISGRFFIDRGTIGVVDPDDIPAKCAWLDLYWLDGTEYYELRTIHTDDDGKWNTTFRVLAPYWTENPMLRIRFKGEWNDGSGPKNLSFRDHNILATQKLLKDDDGDNRSDEEKLDHADNDNDGLIDEDVNAWITKDPIIIDIPFEIHHLPFLEFNITNKRINLGIDPKIGITCNLSDPSQPYGMIGGKKLQIKIDDEVLYEGEAAPTPTDRRSILNTVIEIDDDTKAGAHELKVIMDPDADPINNTGFIRTEVSQEILVQRPLKMVFDDLDPERGAIRVYRGETFWINGSILDLMEYEKTGNMVPPWIYSDLGPRYQFWLNLRFGDPIDLFSFEPTQYSVEMERGKFSFEFDTHMRLIPLGYHNCTLKFIPNCWSSGEAPFEISIHPFTCEMRARTEISIWKDQNKNGINDAHERTEWHFHPYCPHMPPKYLDYGWRYLSIRGRVKDLSQSSGAIQVGVAGCGLDFHIGHGESGEIIIPLFTDANGNFDIDLPIQSSYGCGPFRIFVEMTSIDEFYDLSTYRDDDGDPFSMIHETSVSIEEPNGTLGEWMDIGGKLLDQRGVGIEGANVGIYSNLRYYLEPSDEVTVQTDHIFLGSAKTDELGEFNYSYFLGSEIVGVPQFFARYQGSKQWPEGEDGPRYHYGDAFFGCESEIVKARILVKVNLSDVESVEYIIRNGEANMRGRVVISKSLKSTDRGINGLKVWAEFTQDGSSYFFDEDITESKEEEDGWFHLRIQSVPRDLQVGIVEIKVHVISGTFDREQRVAIPTAISSHTQVWSSTRIKEIYFGPIDAYDFSSHYYPDFQMGDHENWVFIYQVLEGSTVITSGGPVVGGIVWLNITMNDYVNCTMAVTDENGLVQFNYTSDFTDTKTGQTFRISPTNGQANLTIQINFIGMMGYTSSIKTRYSVIKEPPDPSRPNLVGRIKSLILPDLGLKIYIFVSIVLMIMITIFSAIGIISEFRRRKKTSILLKHQVFSLT
jgi:hypothetical protein